MASSGGTGCTLPWVEKYRPTSLQEVTSHGSIIATLEALMDRGCFPNCILWGPPGNGKSSVAEACARRLNGESWRSMLLELNASDDRSIQVVRQQIKVFANTGSLSSFGSMSSSSSSSRHGQQQQQQQQRIKFVFLDEADQMSTNAQFALRRIMEKCSSNVRFCLTANHVNKIIPSLQSRCTRFRFAPLPPQDVHQRLHHILNCEGLSISHDAIAALARISKGDMRVGLNLAQMCCAIAKVSGPHHHPTTATTTTTTATTTPKKQLLLPATDTQTTGGGRRPALADSMSDSNNTNDGGGSSSSSSSSSRLPEATATTLTTTTATTMHITEAMVYRCAGVPPRGDVAEILKAIVCVPPSGKRSIPTALQQLTEYLDKKGFGLNDIIPEVRDQLHEQGFSAPRLCKAYCGLAEVEFNLASGGSETVQCAAFVGLLHHHHKEEA